MKQAAGSARAQRVAGLRWALLAIACLVCSPAASAQAVPPNDNFANATVLSGGSATVTGTNVDATKEAGEPDHAGNSGGHSVWWRWTAPANGGVTIDTCESDFDTVLAVYTGTSVSALTPVKSDDDGCGFESSLTFIATGGQVYSIAVDGLDEEEGDLRLHLQPTLRLSATTVRRRARVDATRFVIEVATGGEDAPDPPQLILERGGRRQSIDLELEGEGEDFSETNFRYTFDWSCERRGRWSWTVSVRRNGQRVAEEGSFTVPRCVVRAWFVSASKVRGDFARDFGRETARYLRCVPVGPTRGSQAHTWRCVLARPGFVCRGGFLFRYSRTFQGGDLVASTRRPSGSVTCSR